MADRKQTSSPLPAAQKKEVQWKFWVFGIAILLMLIVFLQNSQEVAFKFLFIVDTSAPLVVLLLVAAAVGAVIGYTAPILRRHRHQTRKEYGKN
ncbi:MAG: DUF1049 domain-containing protein [Solirubrobacterales bacterium]|jgi:uncharacterized integral membrane protein|nr:DUF1049 domain-containing protein [Solirubrobacterales bacterium]